MRHSPPLKEKIMKKKSQAVLSLEAQVTELTAKLAQTEAALVGAREEIQLLQKPKTERKPAAPKPNIRQKRAALVTKLAQDRGLIVVQKGINTWDIYEGTEPRGTLDYWQNTTKWSLKGDNLAATGASEPVALFDLLGDPLPAEAIPAPVEEEPDLEPALPGVEAGATYLSERM
jgi:hypothetical protein